MSREVYTILEIESIHASLEEDGLHDGDPRLAWSRNRINDLTGAEHERLLKRQEQLEGRLRMKRINSNSAG